MKLAGDQREWMIISVGVRAPVTDPVSRPFVVGRDFERAQLAAMVLGTAAGAGGCTVLTGPPGIGKSCLLDLVRPQALPLGVAVAPGRATELDRVVPLTTLIATLQQCQPDTVDLADLKEHRADRFWYVDRLGEALETCAAERPLLVVIDDAHWADEFSAFALRVLVPELSSAPLHWLLARRPVPAEAPAQQSIDWLVEEGAEHLRLTPLDEGSVNQLCSIVLGARPDATVLGLAGRCGGNPFLVEQMLVAMRGSGQLLISSGVATAVGDELPSSFLAAVEQRLRGLSAQARRLLQAGSIYARPFSVHTAAKLMGVRAADLVPAVEEVVAAGLLVELDDQLSFEHDLLREAIYNNMSGPVRASMHRDAAAVVRTEGRGGEVAEHLMRGGQAGDREAVIVLRDVAAELAAQAPGTAADLIVRALDMVGEHDEARPQLAAVAVGLLASAGRLAQARQLGEAALRSGLDGPTEARLLLGLAESLKHAGQNGASVEYARRALAGESVPDRVRARLHAISAHALLYVDDMRGADREGAEADSLGLAIGEYAASVFGSTARSVVARAAGRLDDALEHARHAVEVADEFGGEAAHRHPRIWLGAALAALDRFAEAERSYIDGRREAERLGTGWSYPLWHHYYAYLLAVQGRLDEAVAEAEAGLRVAEQLTAQQLSVPILALLTRVAVAREQMPLAREHLRRMERLIAGGITAAPEDVAWAFATYHEADGSPQLALSALAQLYDRLPERVLLFCNDPGAAPALVRIAIEAGDPDRAAAAAAAARRLAERNPAVSSLAGAAAHAEGILHRDVTALRRAVDDLRRSPRPIERASAMQDAAVAEQVAGERSKALEHLQSALATATACDALRIASRLERRLEAMLGRRDPAPPPVPASPLDRLTEAELKVARLVADGRTNREAAEELFLSPHTVDSHLRKIFQKLGVNSRVDLTKIVVTRGLSAPPILG
jgi:ATP/maltotriose-dependent transcriptional regulator MalT